MMVIGGLGHISGHLGNGRKRLATALGGSSWACEGVVAYAKQ